MFEPERIVKTQRFRVGSPLDSQRLYSYFSCLCEALVSQSPERPSISVEFAEENFEHCRTFEEGVSQLSRTDSKCENASRP